MANDRNYRMYPMPLGIDFDTIPRSDTLPMLMSAKNPGAVLVDVDAVAFVSIETTWATPKGKILEARAALERGNINRTQAQQIVESYPPLPFVRLTITLPAGENVWWEWVGDGAYVGRSDRLQSQAPQPDGSTPASGEDTDDTELVLD